MSDVNMSNNLINETGITCEGEIFINEATDKIYDDGSNNIQRTSSKRIFGELQAYAMLECIGYGKQAQVYRCIGEDNKKEYAVKLYKLETLNGLKLTETLGLLKDNKHKNICNVVEYGECIIENEKYYYTIMDTYDKLEEQNKQYEWQDEYGEIGNEDEINKYHNGILEFVEQINDGLTYIHNLPIYHSDIKPTNIMYNNKTGQYVLVDFGGATKAAEAGVSEKASVMTQRYAAPESINSSNAPKVSQYTDYYSFGVVLAEFINGHVAGDTIGLNKKYGSLIMINKYLYAPKGLLACYINLLKGMCYATEIDYDDVKKHRWTSDKVKIWLKHMKNGDYEKAATVNKVPDNKLVAYNGEEKSSIVDNKRNLDVDDFGEDESGKIRTVRLKLGNKGEKKQPYRFTNLNEMCDSFAKYWDDGKEQILQGTSFDKASIKGATLNLIIEGRNNMLNCDTEKGESVNARYFEFLYEYMTDKKIFYWGDLPNVHNIKALGIALNLAAKEAYARDGEFGDWTIEEPQIEESETGSIRIDRIEKIEKIELKTKIFAEILSNHVISTYMEAAEIKNEKLMAQCKKVEKIFEDKYKLAYRDRSRCSYEEIIEIYVLARMLKDDNEFLLLSKTKYTSYDEFKKDIAEIATDPDKIHQMNEIMNVLKKENKWDPDFMAWRKVQGS